MILLLRDILHDKYLRVVFGLAFAVSVASAFLVAWGLDPGASRFILHFTRDQGVDVFGSPYRALGIPATGFVIVAVNLGLAAFLYRRERFLSFLFGFGSLGFAVLLFIAVSVIVSVN